MSIERYLCVGGVEVANPNRTLAYMRNLGNACMPTPPSAGCCECPDWEPPQPPIDAEGLALDGEAIAVADWTSIMAPGPDGVVRWTTPAEDDAPWYDPAVPASADVLGVWLEEVQLGTSHERQARGRQWGASLGLTRRPGRELTLVGWVYTRSEAATAYARQWLYEALSGETCGDGCDLPDATIYTHCNRDVPDEGMRYLKRVGLTGWDPNIDGEFPRACGFKFEAVLTAEVPQLVTSPFATVEALLVEGDQVCAICSPCPTPDPAPLACGCMDVPLREVPAPMVSSCYCPPPEVFRTFVQVTPPRYWADAVAIITVESGDAGENTTQRGLANLRIRGWVNPVGLEAPAGDGSNPFECQDPCMDVEVGCVPERSTLVIDGASRRATLRSAGQTVGAMGYLSSSQGRRFSWPEISCHGLTLAIDADAYQTGPGARVRVEFVTRERG